MTGDRKLILIVKPGGGIATGTPDMLRTAIQNTVVENADNVDLNGCVFEWRVGHSNPARASYRMTP